MKFILDYIGLAIGHNYIEFSHLCGYVLWTGMWLTPSCSARLFCKSGGGGDQDQMVCVCDREREGGEGGREREERERDREGGRGGGIERGRGGGRERTL